MSARSKHAGRTLRTDIASPAAAAPALAAPAHLRAMPRVREHKRVARLARRDELGELALDVGARREAVARVRLEQGVDVLGRKAVELLEHAADVHAVVDAAAQLVLGALCVCCVIE